MAKPKKSAVLARGVIFEGFELRGLNLLQGCIEQGLEQTLFGLARFGHQRQLGALQPQPPRVGRGAEPATCIARQVLVTAGSGQNHPVAQLIRIGFARLQREVLDQQCRDFLQGLCETIVKVAS